MSSPLIGRIESQIEAASSDLDKYLPDAIDWKSRSTAAVRRLVPWLVSAAPGLSEYVQDVLNAPTALRRRWREIRDRIDMPEEQAVEFERHLAFDNILRVSITGEIISNVVAGYFIENFPGGVLKSNGRSDYPGLYLSDQDYSALSTFSRPQGSEPASEAVYGAARKGPARRPVRVPDGLEVKTCRGRIAVDCHRPHVGLHFALTTVKYSFGAGPFFSLLPGSQGQT